MRRRLLAIPMLLLALTGCNYHTVGAAAHVPPNIRTLTVPIFTNGTQAAHTEFLFTQSVIRELNTRTRYVVSPKADDADATLTGTIVSQTSSSAHLRFLLWPDLVLPDYHHSKR